MENPKTVKIKGVLAIIIGIGFTIFSLTLMEQLGGMLVVVLLIGPVAVALGIYQVVTGKMFKPGEKSEQDSSNIQVVDTGDGQAEVYAYVNEDRGGLSHEEARELQDELSSVMESSADVSQKINAAARLMTPGLFKECIEAYEKIAKEHPDERGTCEGQIGACYYFLKEYDKAIEHYEAGIKYGADEDMMKDNIKEAREALV